MILVRNNPLVHTLSFLVLFGTIISPVAALSQVTFQRTFGNASADNNNGTSEGAHASAFVTSDGGYVIVGSYGVSSTDPDVMWVKTNSDATTCTVKTIANSQDENGYAGIPTSDGGYAIVGHYNDGANKLYFVKTASDGNVLWSKVYAGSGTSPSAHGFSVVQTNDGGYLLGGSAKAGASGNFLDMYLIKMSSDGTHQWAKGYSNTGSTNDKCFSVIQTTDGGYAAAGYCFNGLNNDAYFVKTDSDGNLSWANQMNITTGNEILYSAIQTSGGDYVVTGIGHGNADLLLLKMNNSGTILWTNTYAFADDSEGRSVKETSDGGFIITGNVQDGSYYNMILMKTAANGAFEWAKVFANSAGVGGSSDEYGTSVEICPDGGYLVAGYTDNPGTGNQIVYVVKTDANGSAASATCPVTTTVTATATARTPATANSPTATSTWSSITSGGSASAPTITVKNPCNNVSILPVEMLDFRISCHQGAIKLLWSTGTEINNDRFEVESGLDAANYETIGNVKGAGNSSFVNHYEFVDHGSFFDAIIYYRIKQVDFNGDFEYFGPLSVRCSPDEIEITPTISEGIYFINGNLKDAEVSVYSLIGEEIFLGRKHAVNSRIDISGHSSGIYLVRVKTPGGEKIQKILKR